MRKPYEFDPTLPLFFLDAETYSFAPLKKNKPLTGHNATCGADVYARHPSTEVLMWSYQDGLTGEPALWDATDPDTLDMPADLLDGLQRCARGEAYAVYWNGIAFDRRILKHCHDIEIPVENTIDLMHLARLACLPASLDGCCKALNIDEGSSKLDTGKKLIQFFCKPYKSTSKGVVTWKRRDRNTHPEKWAEFCTYGLRDTVAMSAIWRKIPKLNWTGPRGDFERRVILADTAINDRGVRINLPLAVKMRDTLLTSKEDLADSTAEEYGINLASNEQFLTELQNVWVARAIPTSGKGAAAKGTLMEYLRDPSLPDAAREMIEARLEVTSKGGGKYDMIIHGTNDDGRYCDGFAYGQASRTLRWAGSRAGFMNMARGHYHDGDEGVWPWDERELQRGIKMLMCGAAHVRYGINKLAASVTRACLLPDEGEELQIADWSNIEGRLAFHLSGGMPGVQKFIDADNGGPGVYELAAAGMFGVPVVDILKEQRQIGKLVSLSSQYGSAHAGFCQFAKGYGFDVAKMCNRLAGTMPADYWSRSNSAYEFAVLTKQNLAGLNKRDWRIIYCLIHMWRDNAEAESGLVTLWAQLQKAAVSAIQNPGRSFWAGQRVRSDGKKAFRFEVPVRKGTNKAKPWLHMELPSGRVVMFAYPELRRGKKVDDAEDEATGRIEIVYKGPDEETGVWGTQRLYGGKLMAIGTQATAREFQAEAIVALHESGQKIVIHCHDENVKSAPVGADTGPFTAITGTVPAWYDQKFPLTYSLDIATEYRK